MRVFVAILVFLLLVPACGWAKPVFIFPANCVLGVHCFVTSTPDLNRAKDTAEDWFCGPQTKEGGNSVDIALTSIAAVKLNVPVLAAADGKVVQVSNNAPDLVRLKGEALPAHIDTCGNGVVIEHAGNWVSSYCHLKKGSVLPKVGDRVQQGQIIGAIGLSGATRWPRLSFSTLRNGMVFDSLSGTSVLQGCGLKPTSFIEGLRVAAYKPAAIADIGVSAQLVDDADVYSGTAMKDRAIHHENAQIVLWSMLLGLRRGDAVTLSLSANGTVLSRDVMEIDKFTDALPVILTANRPRNGFAKGAYKAEITINRKVKGATYATSRAVSFSVK